MNQHDEDREARRRGELMDEMARLRSMHGDAELLWCAGQVVADHGEARENDQLADIGEGVKRAARAVAILAACEEIAPAGEGRLLVEALLSLKLPAPSRHAAAAALSMLDIEPNAHRVDLLLRAWR